MLTPDAMRHKQICKQERGIPLRMALAGLVAGSLLLMQSLAEAAAQSAKPGHAPKTIVVGTASQSVTNAAPRVSPYAIANRQHAAESKATHAPVLQSAARRVSR
jgi:hypothetical protein